MGVAERDNIDGNYRDISTEGVGNTFRHMLMQAVITSIFGYADAKYFGDIKERDDFEKERGFNSDDMIVDLMNNELGRQYAIKNNIDMNTVLSSNENTAIFLNDLTRYILNSIEEYKNDSAFEGLRNGDEAIYHSDDAAVIHFRNFISQANERENQ